MYKARISPKLLCLLRHLALRFLRRPIRRALARPLRRSLRRLRRFLRKRLNHLRLIGRRLIGRRLMPSLIELNVVQRLAIALFDPGLLMIVLRNRTRGEKVRNAILNLPRPRREMLFFGRFAGRERYCPLCQSQVRLFLPFGDHGFRPNA